MAESNQRQPHVHEFQTSYLIAIRRATPTSTKKVSHGCRESFLLAVALETFPRRQQHMRAHHKTSVDSDFQNLNRYAVQR
jgi:hypothetical protein